MRKRTSTPAIPLTHIEVGASYTANLKQRLAQYQISQGALAREADLDESQISRWMNTNMEPRWPSIARIENAITRILARRAIPEPKTAPKRRSK